MATVRLIGPAGPRNLGRKYVRMSDGRKGLRRGRRALIVLGLIWGAALAGAAAYWAWDVRTTPKPPAVALEGYDPAIRDTVSRARAEVAAAPRSAAAWGKLATLLYVHDVRAEADECFAQAERLDPADPRWPYLRARSVATDNPDLAMPHLRRAVALVEHKGDVPAAPRLFLGELLAHRGELDEAESHFRRVAGRWPADARALLGLGRVALERGDLNAARESLARAAQSTPVVKPAHVLLATVQRRLGDDAGADQTLKRIRGAGKEPDWPDPYLADAFELQTGLQASLLKARDLLDTRRPRDAATLMRWATRTYPQSDAAWLYLGRALVRDRDYAEGEKALRSSVRLAPVSVEALVQLGVALHFRRQYDEAAVFFRKAAELKPELAEAHYNLGLALVEQGELAGGAEELGAATRLRPDLVDAHIALGAALVRLGRTREGAERFRDALRLSPGDTRAIDLLRQLGDPAAATSPTTQPAPGAAPPGR